MAYPLLTARTNEKIKAYCKYRDTARARRQDGCFAAEGLRLCADAAAGGCAVQCVFLTEAALQKGGERLDTLLRAAKQVYTVSPEVAEKLADTVSAQGVFGLFSMPVQEKLIPRSGGRYVALDCVQNPQNLGAIARTAEAFGVDALVYSGGCDCYNPKALRASMGSLLRLPVWETADLAETVKRFCTIVPTFATVPDKSAESLCEQNFSGGAMLIIGNEANGISAAVRAAVQREVTIPMRGNAESLNAAAAATVAIWEMMK